ncbi:hypothetical protein LTR56_026629 [Elasticomyces elasticus]|nr:hypothetical protein LTR56_026629 [Elasticomyces elasticus]
MSSTREAPEHYDLIALGSGEGGESIAWHYFSTQGKRFVVVKHKWLHILCAAGRTANNGNLDLDLAGLELTKTGFVALDEHLQTSAPGIFATGDCAGSLQSSHMGFDDFHIVRDHLTGSSHSGNALNHSSNRRSARQVPSTLFTDPQLAHVGLREHEAKALGMSYRLAQVPMSAFLKTHTMASAGDTTGLVKAVISNKGDTILGFTAIGVEAGVLLRVVQLAM